MVKPFAAFDVDGTIFKSSLAEKAVDACIEAKLFSSAPFQDVFAGRQQWQFNNNEDDYQAYLRSLVTVFVGQIKGTEVSRFERVVKAMIDRQAVRKFAFPRQLIKALGASHHLIAISGSPDFLVKPFLVGLGMETIYGSSYVARDGRYTGEATSVGDKAAILSTLVARGVVSQPGSVAVGDTMSDAPMLEYADHAIMFNASKTLTDYGKPRGWARVNEVKDQLTTLYRDNGTGTYVEQDLEILISRLTAIQ